MKKADTPKEKPELSEIAKPKPVIEEPSEPKNDFETKAAEYLAGWKRALADLENYRKRSEEEKQSFVKFAHADVLLQILPVLDNFKRAANHVPTGGDETNWTNWSNGVKAIEKQFEQVLEANGVTQIPVKIGEAFNPTIHEALMSEESDQPADTITAEIEPGYTLNGRVIRPAKVKVSKGRA